MSGEGAEVGVVARCFGGGEVKDVFRFRFDDGDVMEHFREVGDVTFLAGLGIVKHGKASFADFLGGARSDDDEVVRHDVGVFERQ